MFAPVVVMKKLEHNSKRVGREVVVSFFTYHIDGPTGEDRMENQKVAATSCPSVLLKKPTYRRGRLITVSSQ